MSDILEKLDRARQKAEIGQLASALKQRDVEIAQLKQALNGDARELMRLRDQVDDLSMNLGDLPEARAAKMHIRRRAFLDAVKIVKQECMNCRGRKDEDSMGIPCPQCYDQAECLRRAAEGVGQCEPQTK